MEYSHSFSSFSWCFTLDVLQKSCPTLTWWLSVGCMWPLWGRRAVALWEALNTTTRWAAKWFVYQPDVWQQPTLVLEPESERGSSGAAWGVNFPNGFVYWDDLLYGDNYVRCVRSREWWAIWWFEWFDHFLGGMGGLAPIEKFFWGLCGELQEGR